MIRLFKSAVLALLVLSSIAFAEGAPAPTPTQIAAAPALQQAASPRLEYKAVRFQVTAFTPDGALTTILNNNAAEGWQLVSTSVIDPNTVLMFFSRPKQ